MNLSTMEAYAEIDTILGLMDKELVEQIPKKLRNLFKERKDRNYKKNIVPDKPLEEQCLGTETLSILAVLNYNYWCKDELQKAELLKKYTENENKFQEELNEKYNPNDIFKKKNIDTVAKTIDKESNVKMIEYKEPKWYQKIFSKILRFLKKN